MMNKIIFLLAASLLLGACGGGSSDSGQATTPPPAPDPDPVVVSTADLVVPSGFDFRTDRDLTLILTDKPAGSGVVNVYHDFEFHDETNNIYYPDYGTRVLSFGTSVADNIEFQVNRNWEHLIVEYVPTDASGIQQFKRLVLTADNQLEFNF